MSTRLLGVAFSRMAAASESSSWKVEDPMSRLSDAPMRVKMASQHVSLAASAGTKQPIWAMIWMMATRRM